MKNVLVVCAVILPIVLAGSPLAAQADATAAKADAAGPAGAPKLEISPEAMKAKTLSPQDRQKIRQVLEFYANLLRRAKNADAADVDKARTGILAVYRYFKGTAHQYAAAELAAKVLTPLLKLPSLIKQINVALVLSKMPQASVQPALEQMVVHANEAVRYLGWTGYQSIWQAVLAQGRPSGEKMYASLSKQADAETSAVVVAAIWDVLKWRTDVPPTVRDANKRAMTILGRSWTKRCTAVRKGNVAMARAGEKGLAAIIGHAKNSASKNPAAARAAVQMMADLAWSAAKAYQGAHKRAYDKTTDTIAPTAAIQASKLLLLACETSLNELLGRGPGTRERFLRHPLTNRAIKNADRGAAVMIHIVAKRKYGVDAWIALLKNRFKVQEPSKRIVLPKDKVAATPPAAP